MGIMNVLRGQKVFIVFDYKGETKVLPVVFRDIPEAQKQAGKRLSGVVYLPITAKSAEEALKIYENEKHNIKITK
jgi:hypothetical protein